MKKTALATLFFVVLQSFNILQESPTKLILGKWKLTATSVPFATRSIINTVKKSSPETAEQMEENLEAVSAMIGGIEMSYTENGIYEITVPQQGTQTGKWEIANNGKTLYVTVEGRPQRRDSILELTASKLRIINGERKDTLEYEHP
ncbi:MAG: hypothetical protein ACOVNR_06480 [Chitinophagaceae bacterium]